MKLKYKSIKSERRKALVIERINERHFEDNWHYHNEHELIYYIKGKGSRVVGDNLSEFKKGDLVLVGAGLPHLWKNSEEVELDGLDAIIIKFDTNHNAFNLLSMTEFNSIKSLFNLSQRGVKFSEKSLGQIHDLLLSLISADPASQIILFLQVLNILANQNDTELLASPEFSLPMSNSEEQRLNRIISYVSSNYTNPLTLEHISKEAAMTPNSLCRFFKTRTNKTIFQFLNEYRIGKACELLINGDKSISDVCFETGFNSLTSFNRVFKDLKSLTPRDFKRKYQTLNTGLSVQACFA
ncbi:AraC family transcriptional regulator [Carboxylicivirga marina]|uniref:Helix-turn-helix domain-containing protein n=1 Tax=Carboxylicivirga marina TaxID=2800988 RepID=A0ABS1HG18_9BACT|nr:AraC family transcriptional regulator [Carboxylicivirga marina]MBK3516139.1 helix-turn-helix domain-containing protein [Carboxylicivirga marina]